MESSKRVIMSLALVAIIAVAAIGIGYAYTATTSNTNNTASNEYITLVQGSAGAYNFADGTQKIYWDTVDQRVGTGPYTYQTNYKITGTHLAGDTVGCATNAYTLVKVGKSFTLLPENKGATSAPSITIEINATNFNMPFSDESVHGAIFMIVSTEGEVQNQIYKLTNNNQFQKKTGAAGVDEFNGDNLIAVDSSTGVYKPLTVSIYYGYTGTDGFTVTHASGEQPEGPSSNPINDASLLFWVNTAGANTPNDPENPLNGITLNKYAMNFIYGSVAQTATVTYTNGSTESHTVTCSSGNTDIATVAMDGTTITVTPVGAGSTIIKVTAGEGSYTKEIAVTVAKKAISVTLTHAAVAYGTELPTSDYTATTTDTLKSGDSLNTSLSEVTIQAEGYDGSVAGDYKLYVGTGPVITNGSTDVTSNYDITYTGSITVNPSA